VLDAGEKRAWCDVELKDAIVIPGSFNPLHEGHLRMAAAAVEASALVGRGQRSVVFEITTRNADKGAVDRDELSRRAAQFSRGNGGDSGGVPLVLTRARLFVEKARLFPNCTFVVGADTVARLIDRKYYNSSDVEMAASLAAIGGFGCDFLVAGRDMDSGYTTLDDLSGQIPEFLRSMFSPLKEDGISFRVDISSTQLRERAAAAETDLAAVS